MKRPVTTLFMLQSLDGKISTGVGDNFDFDIDLPKIPGDVSEGLHQYYEEETETDLWSLNSGKVMAKIGANTKDMPEKLPVNFVVIDNHNLTEHGVRFMSHKAKQLVIVTSNNRHPVFGLQSELGNITVIQYKGILKPKVLMNSLYNLGCDALTIQTGGTLNNLFLRSKVIDRINVVVAPILIGGKDTPTLFDGADINNLSDLGSLKLLEVKQMKNSYLQLKYEVTYDTGVSHQTTNLFG